MILNIQYKFIYEIKKFIYLYLYYYRRFYKMSLRKNRVPLQGLSNFRLTQNDWKVSMKNIWNPIE